MKTREIPNYVDSRSFTDNLEELELLGVLSTLNEKGFLEPKIEEDVLEKTGQDEQREIIAALSVCQHELDRESGANVEVLKRKAREVEGILGLRA